MPSVAILDDYDRLAVDSPSIQALRAFADVHIFHEPATPDQLQPFDALIPVRERTRFPPALFATLHNLRHVAQTGGGVAHIDLKAAASYGIAVSVTPGGSAQSVAELTLGLLLAMSASARAPWRTCVPGMRGRPRICCKQKGEANDWLLP